MQGGYISSTLKQLYPLAQAKAAEGSGKPTGLTVDQLLSELPMLGSGEDLAFIVFAMQIEQMAKQSAQSIKEIQLAGKARDAINTQLNKLGQLKSLVEASNAKDKDDKAAPSELVLSGNYTSFAALFGSTGISVVDPTNGLPPGFGNWTDGVAPDGTSSDSRFKHYDPKDPSLTDAQRKYLKAFAEAYKDLGMQKQDFITDPATGAVKAVDVGDVGHWEGSPPVFRISKTDVDAEINRLKGMADTLDSDREIRMISFNQGLNRKEQATSQLTNIIKKADEILGSIINNLK